MSTAGPRRPRRRPPPWPAEEAPPLTLAPAEGAAAEYADVLRNRLEYLVPVAQPLVLISQSGRSGGTLLVRLFDGHPQCHVVPYELQQMFRGMARLGDPGLAWGALAADKLFYRRRPFTLRPALQRAIFDDCVGELGDPGPRQLMDAWFTSFFNAWLDNTNLRTGPKRWVMGFEPRSATKLDAHARLYPDGRVLSVIRDPWGWFASRREKRERWSDPEVALASWRAQVEAALARRLAEPDRTSLVRFTDLIGRPEETMAALAGRLGLDADPSLLAPSFNGVPSGGRSSFSDLGVELSKAPLERAGHLTADERTLVDRLDGGLYEEAVAHAIEIGA